MRILITGYTGRMCAARGLTLNYTTFSTLLGTILKEMGHEVDQRVVPVTEDVRGMYNYAFCGLAPIGSMTAGRICETHHVMDMMRGSVCNFADDWSFCGYLRSAQSVLRRWPMYTKYRNWPFDPEIIEDARFSVDRLITMTIAGNNPPLLAPMFPWGKHTFLLENNYNANLVTIDPSPWVRFPTIDVYPRNGRKTQWVMAALSDHSRWLKKQGFTVPIRFLGNKRLGAGEVVTEVIVIREFAQSTGILSAGYPSAGSGWWRTRYLNAIWAETPIYCDLVDQATMGKAYCGTARDFEREIGTSAWDDRVAGQKEWFEANVGKKEEAMDRLNRLLTGY